MDPRRDELLRRVENDFAYHSPKSQEVATRHDSIRQELMQTAKNLIHLTPLGREQALMLTALEEAMHWANAAVAKTQYEGESNNG